jgi:hypothetical protein
MQQYKIFISLGPPPHRSSEEGLARRLRRNKADIPRGVPGDRISVWRANESIFMSQDLELLANATASPDWKYVSAHLLAQYSECWE